MKMYICFFAFSIFFVHLFLNVKLMRRGLFSNPHLRIFFFLFFRERGERREKERDTHLREKTQIGCLLYVPYRGSNLQPRRVPGTGIEPATFWRTG